MEKNVSMAKWEMPIWKACVAFKSVTLTQQTDQQLPGVGEGGMATENIEEF